MPNEDHFKPTQEKAVTVIDRELKAEILKDKANEQRSQGN